MPHFRLSRTRRNVLFLLCSILHEQDVIYCYYFMLFLRKKQLLICKIMPSICIRKSKICHVMIFVKVSKMPRADWWLQVLIDCLRRGTMAGEGGGARISRVARKQCCLPWRFFVPPGVFSLQSLKKFY